MPITNPAGSGLMGGTFSTTGGMGGQAQTSPRQGLFATNGLTSSVPMGFSTTGGMGGQAQTSPKQSMFGPAPASSTQGGVYTDPNTQVALNPGFGNVSQVQNAMMSRLQPQRDINREAELSRLKAQGISEDSNAWARSMDTLNRGDTDAQMQALLAGTAENNNIFNRSLSQNNQVFGQGLAQEGLTLQQRQQALTEQNNPYQQALWTQQMQPGNPAFQQFTNAGAGVGTNYTGAGQSQYAGNLGNYNAQTAANNGLISGIGQIAGGIGNSMLNGQNSAGNGLMGGFGNWLSSLFGGNS
jgi:hypothetical protein